MKSHVCSHVEVTAINTDVNFARGHRSPRSPRRIQPTASSGASCVSATAECVAAVAAISPATAANTTSAVAEAQLAPEDAMGRILRDDRGERWPLAKITSVLMAQTSTSEQTRDFKDAQTLLARAKVRIWLIDLIALLPSLDHINTSSPSRRCGGSRNFTTTASRNKPICVCSGQPMTACGNLLPH